MTVEFFTVLSKTLTMIGSNNYHIIIFAAEFIP